MNFKATHIAAVGLGKRISNLAGGKDGEKNKEYKKFLYSDIKKVYTNELIPCMLELVLNYSFVIQELALIGEEHGGRIQS